MRLICSYCRNELGRVAPLDDDTTSHGMCEQCAEHFRRQWSGLSISEYLDTFDAPVVVLDSDARVIAANQPMATMLGKEPRRLFGLLGGEALECEYSRLPDGCGRTLHCETCTIRNAVMRTMETRRPLHREPAFLWQSEGRQDLAISTEYVDGVVRVTVEKQAKG